MPNDFPYALTAHSAKVIDERSISLDWIIYVLKHPMKVESDREDATLRHAMASIPERGDRVLRVVYNEKSKPWRIITAYFDRKQRSRS